MFQTKKSLMITTFEEFPQLNDKVLKILVSQLQIFTAIHAYFPDSNGLRGLPNIQ